jgi:RND family efflux transporter MFP subunit
VNTASQLARAKLEMRTFEDAIIKLESEAELYPLRIEHTQKKRSTHQTDLEIALEELSRTRVTPPFNGTISEVLVEQGQFVQPGTSLVRLTDTSRIEVPVPITLDEFSRIEGRLRSEDFPRVELAENVTSPSRWNGFVVRAAPVADELTRTIMVYVSVDNSSQDVPLKPGTFVHARIAGPILENAIVVPRDAIVADHVFVAGPAGTAVRRPLTISRTLQSLALVESGVEAGEQIVLTNLDVLYQGAEVQVESHQQLDDILARQRERIVERAAANGRQANAAGPR